ncbi:MAG: nucleotide sugar dehydrogenase [Haloarcula sp.]
MSTVSVHGLGYVGLPTAALFAHNGYQVFGIDTDTDRLRQLESRGADFKEPELQEFVNQALSTPEFELGREPVQSDYHLICVPTPYDEDEEEATLTYVRSAAERLSTQLRAGDTVVVESTVPPGTTTDLVGGILADRAQHCYDEINLAFCPETVLPGSIYEELRENDRIVGGVDDESTRVVRDLFGPVIEGEVYAAPDARTAEFVKLTQNTFRDVNIALANELAKVAHDYDIEPRDAFELVNTHPRVSLHRPGPGVGGHCLPVDPLYLGHGSDELDLVEKARETNDEMIEYVYEKLRDGLGSLDEKQIAVLGLAYKAGVGDTRNSPGKRFVERISNAPQKIAADGGGSPSEVRAHDPHVEEPTYSQYSLSGALDGADALVFMTGHQRFEEIDPETITTLMDGNLVIDATDTTDESWVEQGLDIRKI